MFRRHMKEKIIIQTGNKKLITLIKLLNSDNSIGETAPTYDATMYLKG